MRTALSRNTVRAALRRASRRVIHGRRRDRSSIRPSPRSSEGSARRAVTGQRIRTQVAPHGFDGDTTIIHDLTARHPAALRHASDVSAHRLSARRELRVQSLWSLRAEVPVGHGQRHRPWVVVACLGYSRAGAGAPIFSAESVLCCSECAAA